MVAAQKSPFAFDDPASFAQGERIAIFRRTSLVVGTTIDVSGGANLTPVIGSNVFSARLGRRQSVRIRRRLT